MSAALAPGPGVVEFGRLILRHGSGLPLFVELHPEMIRRVGDTPEDVCALLRDSGYDVECWSFQRARRASLDYGFPLKGSLSLGPVIDEGAHFTQ